MLNRYYSWLRKTPLRVIIGCLCIICGLVLVLFLLQPHAAIHPPSTPKANLTLQVSLGFQGDYREEYWTPAQVTITNNGPDFKGTLSVSVFSGPSTTPTLIGSTAPWSYETPVALPKKATKQVTLYIPFYFGNLIPQGFLATLRDANGKVVATGNSANNQNAIPYAVKTGNLLIGLLADPNADFTALGNASIPNQTSSLTLVPLDAHTLPTMEAALENFDVIVLDNFSSNTLNTDQLLALRSWVNRGGVLIEVGGSNWQQTLSNLPADLQPITVHGTTTLPAGTHLLPVSAPITQTADQSPPPSDKSPETLTVSAATIHTTKENSFSDPETILTSGTNPLIVQAHQGAGVICYLAFDPARSPLASWSATSTLWRAVLFYGMGDHFLVSNIVRGYNSGPGQLLTRGGVLSLLEPELPLGPWIIAVLFLGYLLVLGPIRLLIIRRLKLPMWWSWRIFMASIVFFSLLAYGLAFYQRGAAITENSISIVQINQGGSSAHITTYMGIYTPDNGDVTLHIPGTSLAQTVAQPYLRNNLAVTSNNGITSSIDLPTTTISDPTQTDLTLHELSRWTFNPIIAERDRQLHGALTTHLKLLNNKLQGTITNTLDTSLSDAYILLPHSIVPVGHIPAGATQQINLPLYSASPNSGKMLADQIAAQSGLPDAYFPYIKDQQPQTDLQHHVAFLSAMSGAGFVYLPCNGTCLTHDIVNRDTIYPTGGQSPNSSYSNDYDPLLIAGAPATLVAWTDEPLQELDNITTNGVSPAGRHTSFLQMPLNLDLAGSLQTPPDFIIGRAIDMTYDAQTTLPGIYSTSTGNVTFAITLPDTTHMRVNSMTITIPDLTAHPSSSGLSTSSSLQAQFYNWRTSSWNKIQLNLDTFTTADLAAYAGPTGQILLQISKQHTQSIASSIFFSRPYLSLQGSTS